MRVSNKEKKEKKLSIVFRHKLLKVTAVILLISIILIAVITPLAMSRSVTDILTSELNEPKEEIKFYSGVIYETFGFYFTDEYPPSDTESIFKEISNRLINIWYIVNSEGIVEYSSDKAMVGAKASDDPVLSEFREHLADKEMNDTYVPEISLKDFNSGNWIKRVGTAFGDGGFIIAGYTPDQYYTQLDESLNDICDFKTIGTGGMVIITRQDGSIVSPSEKARKDKGIKASKIDIEELQSLSSPNNQFEFNLHGTRYFAFYSVEDGYYTIALIPRSDIMMSLNIIMAVIVLLTLLMMVIIFLRVNSLTKKLIVNNIGRINSELEEITGGNLDNEIDVKDHLEFRQLSDGINSTVSSLKGYIARESERFNKELELAHSIQTSSLPNVFPPFPERHDIDIYATMKPAKEVGGDFYDFFFIDNTHFAFLTADVSDKGIPAAMFMMKAKTIIKSLATAKRSVEDIILIANNTLCEDNSADMFVTLWFGILDTETGIVSYINAGHCKPLVRRADGEFAFVESRPDFVVAGEEGVTYHSHELKLTKGDALFLYTDGITEATDVKDVLYGEERLRKVLCSNQNSSAKEMCDAVHEDILSYSKGADQTDDITMLAVVFKGVRTFDEMTVEAETKNLGAIYDFLDEYLNASGFDTTSISQIGIIADEICANIIHYAYPGDKSGKLTVRYSFNPTANRAEITFIDNGIPFNPLNAPEPDVINAESNPEGGLGIFLVRRLSDKILYEYSDDKNILTVFKNLKIN